MSLLHIIRLITDHPLNREHKLSSIIRFAKWQVGSRLVPGAIVYDWINGSRFLVRTGEKGLTVNIYTGLYEFPDMGFLLHFLRAEDLFVDIGANVGSYSILACSAVGARGVAFEPVPSTYKRLVENIRLNHLDERVKCINKGVGAQQGTITFTSDSDTTNHVLAPGEQSSNKVTVDVTSLDTVLQGECPSLIKIDVEGFETPVLDGAQETLENPTLDAVIMELNGSGSRYGFEETKILDMMINKGFRTYSYNPFTRTLINLEGKNLNSGNTLFIRDKALVEERLRLAPKVSVYGRQF
jgi:FkbM family methyltransferase